MMVEANRDNCDQITALTADACVALWRDYGITLTPASIDVGAADEPLLFGVIGFVGDSLRATCLLGAPERLIQASGRTSNQPRDWIAELANQLIGRVKMRLLGSGVSVNLTTPLALSGVRLKPLPRISRAPVTFDSGSGPVVVWLELETEPSFELPAERPLSFAPGDLVF